MKTIFALFGNYGEARAAVAELLDRHFDPGDMNLIVREPAAHTVPEGNFKATNESGLSDRLILQEIERVLPAGKSVVMPDVGIVRAAGGIAAPAARGPAPEKPPRGLKDILASLRVPEELAEFYSSGILEGGLLFWVRVDDNRVSEASSVLSTTRAERLANYA